MINWNQVTMVIYLIFVQGSFPFLLDAVIRLAKDEFSEFGILKSSFETWLADTCFNWQPKINIQY
ncbi:hypothetical protein G6549_27065 [Bacillus sp. MM2020_1]|nr:hypothetical protein [Bacillus sp. MM2020_1]